MRLKVRLDVALISALVIVAAVCAMSWLGASLMTSNLALQQKAGVFSQRLDHVLEDLVDIETAVRGFVISGDERFLEPYDRAMRDLPEHVALLHAATVDDPEQQARAHELDQLMQRRAAHVSAVLAERRAHGFDPAVEKEKLDEGKALMDQARALIHDMDVAADNKVAASRAHVLGRSHVALAMIVGSTIAVGVLALSALVVLRRRIITPLAALASAAKRGEQGEWQRLERVHDDEIGALDGALAEMVKRRNAAKQALRDFVEDAPEAVFVADLEGVYTSVNAAACRLLGYQRSELIGKTILDLIPREDVPRLVAARERLLRPGAESVEEWRLRSKSGELVPVEVSAKILPDGRWQAFVRDLTERKRLEAALKAAVAARDQLIEDAPEALVVANGPPRYELVTVNRAAENLLGYSRGELLGQSLVVAMPPDEQERLAAARARLANPGDTEVAEWRLRAKSGEEIPIEAVSKLLPDGRRQAFIRDLRDRKRLEEAQQASLRAREQLIAVVSHDLKNPLGAIELRVRLLEKQIVDESQRKHLASLHRSVGMMERQIHGLLDAASLEAGRLRLELGDHDLQTVIGEVVDVLGAVATDRGIELVADVEPGIVRRFDRERIAQVIYNLVGNALKFTPSDGKVTISVCYTPAAATVTVADTGAGIAPEAVGKIFERFYTSGGRTAGTGLGLDIAKGIVEAHGGTISVTSASGQGSAFTFTIPAPPRTAK